MSRRGNGTQATVKAVLTSAPIMKHCMHSLNAFVPVITLTLKKKRYVDLICRVQGDTRGGDIG